MQRSKYIAVLLAASMLVSCTEPDGSPGRGIENGGALSKKDVGTAVGVVGGGLIGSAFGAGAGQVAAVIGGGLLGGILGNSVGQSMDNADRAAYDRASQRAMETGQTRGWRNNDTGNYGIVKPYKNYTNYEGQYCRKYKQRIYIDGEKHTGHGTACREDDGTWKIVQ